MKTNLEKWNYYKGQLDDINKRFLDEYFKDRPRPTVYYKVRSWKEIEETTISEIRISVRVPSFDKRPTKKNISALIDILNNYTPDENNIYLDYTHSHDGWKSSGSEKLSKVLSSDRMSFNREELIPKWEEMKELYTPREGYEPCSYCGKQVKKEDLVSRDIISYHNWPDTGRRTFKYCSGKCGGYDQMAHEG